MNKQEIEKRADQTLRDNGMHRVPVTIEVLAHKLNLTTQAAELGDHVSGVLVVEKGRGAIGYNSDHAVVRQRFTIAHEIAHYLLHVKNHDSQLFIDKYVAYRSDTGSSNGSDQDEVEANHLGAALLMPEILVLEQIKKHELDLDDDEDVILLAKQFQVSTIAMTYRLTNLGLLR
jgi:Zn-dependent peptidase ImmA (M78 family)